MTTPVGQGVSQNPVARRTRDDQPEALGTGDVASRDDGATLARPACGQAFTPPGRARYCSERCRKKAWRRRRTPAAAPRVARSPAARSPCTSARRAAPAAWASSDAKAVGPSWPGSGGVVPILTADEPVAVEDLATR